MYHVVVSPTQGEESPSVIYNKRGADSRQMYATKYTRNYLLPPVFLGVRERVIQTLRGVRSEMRSQQNSLEPAILSSSLSMLDGFLCTTLN